jgi:hypothetical protein
MDAQLWNACIEATVCRIFCEYRNVRIDCILNF